MKTITLNIKSYFDNPAHATVNEFWFTNDHLQGNGSDQYGFFKEHEANNHATNLKDKGVTRVTRAEVEAWAKEQAVEWIEVEVTQDMLDMNPEMVEQGFALGEIIQIPKDDTQSTEEEIKDDVKAAVTAKNVKKTNPAANAQEGKVKKAAAKKK